MIDNPSVRAELRRLQNAPLARVYHEVSAELLVGTRVIKVVNVVSLDNTWDCVSNFTDLFFARIQVGLVTYGKLIYPQRDKLKLRLFFKTQDDRENTKPGFKKVYSTYNCHLTNPADPAMENTSPRDESEVNIEASRLVSLDVQLTEEIVTPLLFAKCGGVNKKLSLSKVLEFQLGHGLEKRQNTTGLTSDRYEGVRGVDIVRPSNTRVYENVLIPSNTPLIELPKFLHERYGLYAAGLGYYFRRGYWYIYPMYDVTRWRPGTRRMTIYNFPKQEFPSAEKTFTYAVDHLTVFTGGNPITSDQSEQVEYNQGTGVSFTRSKAILGGMVKSTGNKAVIQNKDTHRRVAGIERADKLNNITDIGITDNPYPAMSKIAAGKGKVVPFTWDNADPELVYPGMPVKVIYEKGGKLYASKGTLIAARYKTSGATAMLADNGYRTTMIMTVFLETDKVPIEK